MGAVTLRQYIMSANNRLLTCQNFVHVIYCAQADSGLHLDCQYGRDYLFLDR